MRQVAVWEKRASVIVAVAVVVIAATRAMFGISFFDDSYYVVVPLRMAMGARLFADEAALQPLGSLLAVPFVALWHALFGLSGIVLASRLFYVALATVVGFFTVRALKPSFGPFAPVVAISAIALAPAYTTFALSYNTVAQLSFVLTVALVFAARRDGSRAAAAAAGALAALGCISYPPLSIAAIPAAVVAIIVLRRNRLWLWLVGSALLLLCVAAAGLLLAVPTDAIARAFEYSKMTAYSGTGGSVTVLERGVLVLREIKRLLVSRAWWPAIGLAILLAIPAIKGRLRGWLAVTLPVFVALPAVHALTRGVPWTFGVPVLSYLLAFTLSLVPLAVVAAAGRDTRRADLRLLLLLGVSFSAVAVVLLPLVTSSGFVSGMAGVGAAPFGLAAVIAWLWLIGEWAGSRAVRTAAALLLAVEVALFFSTAYRDVPPLQTDAYITQGAAAGIRTGSQQAETIANVERVLGGLTEPGSTVLVVNAPLVYLLSDATPLTYATWVNPGPADQGVIDYFDRVGKTPDVVVLSRALLSEADDSVAADPTDPLITWVTRTYERTERAGYVIFRRR